MTNEKLPKRRNRSPANTTSRLTDEQLRTFDELLGPGFSQWYRATHDEQGKVLPEAKARGLTLPEENESEE